MSNGFQSSSRFARRSFLAAAGIVVVAAAARLPRGRGERLVLAGGEDRGGRFYLVGLTDANKPVLSVPVPQRLHGGTQHPVQSSRAVFVARRPGTRAFDIDLHERRIVGTIRAATGRHFYGHAEHTADGAALLTTENDYASGRGKIVVRDRVDYSILAEYESGGIGPHDLRLLSDGVTLAIANGGIRTHPANHRQKLNLETMAPSLTYIDIRTGKDHWRL